MIGVLARHYGLSTTQVNQRLSGFNAISDPHIYRSAFENDMDDFDYQGDDHQYQWYPSDSDDYNDEEAKEEKEEMEFKEEKEGEADDEPIFHDGHLHVDPSPAIQQMAASDHLDDMEAIARHETAISQMEASIADLVAAIDVARGEHAPETAKKQKSERDAAIADIEAAIAGLHEEKDEQVRKLTKKRKDTVNRYPDRKMK